MVSATNFVEITTVDNGVPNVTVCGACQIPNTTSYRLTAEPGENWFGGQLSMAPGTYKVTFNGANTVTQKVCVSAGDFSWYVPRVTEPALSGIAVDLTKWSAVGYDLTKDGTWTVDNNKAGATQANYGQLGFFASKSGYVDETFTITFTAGTSTKTDPQAYVGAAWGMGLSNNIPNYYYLLEWKEATTDVAANISLIRVVNSAGENNTQMYNRLYAAQAWTDGTAQVAIAAQKTGINWIMGTTYSIQVTYKSDGTSAVVIADSSGKSIWNVTYVDPQPLGIGSIALYTLGQGTVHYTVNLLNSVNQIMYDSPPGSICVADSDHIIFNGMSDDIAILYGQSDSIETIYDGIPGDPATFILPNNCILFNDNAGYFVSPGSVRKTFMSGSGSNALLHIIPAGLSDNSNAGGHVSDFAIEGFKVVNWGSSIPVSLLRTYGWVDGFGAFNFKMSFIPCGSGTVTVSGVQTSGSDYAPPSVPTTWKIDQSVNGTITTLANAPSSSDGSVTITIAEAAQIGINLISTPSALSRPQFTLSGTSVTINQPRQVTWIQSNAGGRLNYYDFEVTVDGRTYSTESAQDCTYFRIDGQQWGLGSVSINPLSKSTIAFIIPFDPTDILATVSVILNGSSTTAVTRTIPVTPRTVTRIPLKLNRDLIDPTIVSLTAQIAAQRKYININNYTPYLFANNRLIPISWSDSLSNGDRLLCISNAVDTSEDQIIYSLTSSTGILPRRYV